MQNVVYMKKNRCSKKKKKKKRGGEATSKKKGGKKGGGNIGSCPHVPVVPSDNRNTRSTCPTSVFDNRTNVNVEACESGAKQHKPHQICPIIL